MPAPLSAIEAISPAFEHTKRQLFQSFRLGLWARLGVVSLLTGEFTAGSWSGAQGFSIPSGREGSERFQRFLSLAAPDWQRLLDFFPWIVAAVVVVLALGLVWSYVASVFRFILLDAVLTDRSDLAEGWRRRQQQGGGYFLFLIAFVLATLTGMALLVGGPVYLAWREGVFREPDRHLALLVLGGVVLFFLALGLLLLSALAAFLTKDFVIPLMAVEELGVLEAWRRLLPLLRAEKAAYLGYLLMKIVLAVGSSILFGIVNVMVLVALLIPLGIAGVILLLVGKAAGLTWTLYTIGAVTLLGVAALVGVLYVLALVSAPALVFFQAYTLHFFGSRYPALGALLGRAPGAAQVTRS